MTWRKRAPATALLLMNGSPYWISYALLGRQERTYLKLVQKERTDPAPNKAPASLWESAVSKVGTIWSWSSLYWFWRCYLCGELWGKRVSPRSKNPFNRSSDWRWLQLSHQWHGRKGSSWAFVAWSAGHQQSEGRPLALSCLSGLCASQFVSWRCVRCHSVCRFLALSMCIFESIESQL